MEDTLVCQVVVGLLRTFGVAVVTLVAGAAETPPAATGFGSAATKFRGGSRRSRAVVQNISVALPVTPPPRRRIAVATRFSPVVARRPSSGVWRCAKSATSHGLPPPTTASKNRTTSKTLKSSRLSRHRPPTRRRRPRMTRAT